MNILFEGHDVPPDLIKLLDEYELIRELGHGGMASVYLARERAGGRLMAIKAIRPRYAEDREAIARFAREARTVATLDHPNIVRTYGTKPLGDKAFAIVMQYVDGVTLRDALREDGPFGFPRVERVLRDVAEALRYAHARGLVHRDVKPGNIFIETETGRALLSDFGIARSIDSDTLLTMTGTAIGTPAYMSPEQIDGKPVDGRTDIYSLGLVGWEMLAGRRPWESDSLYSVIYKQKHEELPRLTELRPDIPTPLLFAIEGALHKHRDTRWADVAEFLSELLAGHAPLDGAPVLELHRATVPDPSDQDEIGASSPDAAATAAPVTVNGGDDDEAVIAAIGVRPTPRVAPAFQFHRPPATLHPPRRRASRRTVWVGLAFALMFAVALAVAGGALSRRNADRARWADSLATSALGGTVARDSAADSAVAAAPPAAMAPDSAIPLRQDTLAIANTAPSAAASSGASSPSAPVSPRSADSGRPRGGSGASAVRPASRSVARARTHADSLRLCRTPGGSAQAACFAASLADADAELNRNYRSLIAELRRQAGVSATANDPSSVQRLRVEQRTWVARRDAECLRRGRGREGAVWAPIRARCLGEFATRRAAELASALGRSKHQ